MLHAGDAFFLSETLAARSGLAAHALVQASGSQESRLHEPEQEAEAASKVMHKRLSKMDKHARMREKVRA